MTLTALTWLVLSAATAAPTGAQIQAVLTDEAGWSADGNRDGVAIFTKPVPGSEIAAWKGVRVTDVDPMVIWALICDVDNHDRVSDMLHETKVLARKGSRIEYYQVSKSPRFLPVSERYWINYAEMSVNIGGVPGHNLRTWNSVEDVGSYSELISGITTRYPDAIRLVATHGSWEIKPLANGGTEITYRTYSDPGGSVPISFLDYVSGKTLPDNILRFEEAARTE
jgi:hypothetical protein